jgi:hypothetical protein
MLVLKVVDGLSELDKADGKIKYHTQWRAPGRWCVTRLPDLGGLRVAEAPKLK